MNKIEFNLPLMAARMVELVKGRNLPQEAVTESMARENTLKVIQEFLPEGMLVSQFPEEFLQHTATMMLAEVEYMMMVEVLERIMGAPMKPQELHRSFCVVSTDPTSPTKH